MEGISTKSLITTAGISLIVSTTVVMINNYFFYRYHCKKQEPKKLTIDVNAELVQ